jgi:hypothetical protein
MDGLIEGDIERGIAVDVINADMVLTVDFQERKQF